MMNTNIHEMVKEDQANYKARKNSDKKLISLSEEVLQITAEVEKSCRKMFHPDSLNHADVMCYNIINTTESLKLIDWEKPRVDDCSYDICCFLCHPYEVLPFHIYQEHLHLEGVVYIYLLF